MENAESKAESSGPNRVTLIGSVNTPLGFFVLMVSVVESGILLTMAKGMISPQLEMLFGKGALVILCLLILVVAGIAIFKPEVLSGKHYSIDNLARALGDDVTWAFNRYITNLEDKEERKEAVDSLKRIMGSKTDVAHRRIRAKIVKVIEERMS